MIDPIPQDPAPWASKLLALKNASPFQAFSVVMIDGRTYPVSRPEYIEVTSDGTFAKVGVLEDYACVLALEWVVGLEVGGDVGAPPRPPRFAANLRALQTEGPDGPLVLTLHDGRQFSLAGPHRFLIAPDGRSVAVCVGDGGFAILPTSEITGLAPRT